jgi:hypothetical protein
MEWIASSGPITAFQGRRCILVSSMGWAVFYFYWLFCVRLQGWEIETSIKKRLEALQAEGADVEMIRKVSQIYLVWFQSIW